MKNNSGNIEIRWQRKDTEDKKIISVIIFPNSEEERGILKTISRDLASGFAGLVLNENQLAIIGRGGQGYKISRDVEEGNLKKMDNFLRRAVSIKYRKNRLVIVR